METTTRRDVALQMLAATGMWRSNFEPPLVRLLWRLGVDVPPPHFAPFRGSALTAGGCFAFAWGLFMWLFVWRSQGISITVSLISAVIAGAIFGIAMASYYAYGRKRYALPPWRSLQMPHAGA